jgi:hypothetical protein
LARHTDPGRSALFPLEIPRPVGVSSPASEPARRSAERRFGTPGERRTMTGTMDRAGMWLAGILATVIVAVLALS